MAFDNCTELERWEDLAAFATDMNKDGDRVHFTFFVSGSNFLADTSRNSYQAPHQGRGYSRISFGGSSDDVRRRIAYVNELRRNGHEIASHAVGHFDGRAWSSSDWNQEFNSYREIFDHAAPNNAMPAEAGFAFSFTDIVGFRAPYLANGAGLYTTLREHHFRYDASGESESNAWPEQKDGVWRFNLASIPLNHSGKHLLSMDYNFFVAQSHAVADPRRHDADREQTLQTYLDYFKANYTGNRAPVHIGHHFFDYQGGAYREALKEFARAVCGLPEVRCITYEKLADVMDGLDQQTLAAYRAGAFPHADEPVLDAITVSAQAQSHRIQ